MEWLEIRYEPTRSSNDESDRYGRGGVITCEMILKVNEKFDLFRDIALSGKGRLKYMSQMT